MIDLDLLVNIVEKAGEEAMRFHGDLSKTDIEIKSDDTPVTKADFAAHKLIISLLETHFPEIPRLSEESSQDVFDKRLYFDRYFLIDPIDGTKEFIKISGEFTVNIAYIEGHQVIAGVVGLPAKNEVFFGTRKESFVKRDAEILKLPLEPFDKRCLRVVSSKSHPNKETDQYILNLRNKFEKVESLQFGSSLKICKVAEGVADLNPRLGGTSEWDIAAAHAVLLGAGGNILEIESGKEVLYNKESLLNPHYEARRKELLGFNFIKS
ncbi:MAG: 3'(2'),5'-bisphosphate nucleotidase CysQ [Halobacteriovoraceae bacterium]|nr:3'(2'),5'-bisphosphate nucleotidase CysQ [Halobacteriovoraceae bacterium]|tara:strand:+ start:155508 stop:156305 length:798 start_codon:yes stop_codon:yes gene_type:complete